jgi:hypothetical protein
MNTRNLNLPTWDEGNTEPDLVFNQLLLVVDALLKSGVESIETTPPGSPVEGQAWIVGTGATGAWVGHDDDIAISVTGGSGWKFVSPVIGWSIWVVDLSSNYQYLTSWEPVGGTPLSNPMTAIGDMIQGGTSGTPLRVANGTTGQVPTVQSDGSVAMQTLPFGSAVSSLSIASGVVNIDLSAGDYFTLALTTNVTSIIFSNLPSSGKARTVMIRMKQDATGGRTVALPVAFKAVTGSDLSVQSTPNAYTILAFTTFDQGTRWEYSMKALAA